MEPGRRSPKFYEVRSSLPEELRPIYEELVTSYAFYSLKYHGREWVSFQIIADLVKEGWRPETNDRQQA
jgi:hypothetical protein